MKRTEVLFIGDLHISDRYMGKHRNYLENCFKFLDQVYEIVKRRTIKKVVFMGDWIGVGPTEKNLRDRNVLCRLFAYLKKLNSICEVYSLAGNHDMGSNITDFEILVEIGFLKQVDYLDIEDELRIHMFNYGSESREIELDAKKVNIGAFHANLLIEGLTTWYRGGEGKELSSLTNLKGISYAIGGHIHDPSPGIVSTTIGGEDISLLYLGCGPRPAYTKDIYESVWGVVACVEDGEVRIEYEKIELPSVADTFDLRKVENKDKEEDIPEVGQLFNTEELSQVLSQLSKYTLNEGIDYRSQVIARAGLDKVAGEVALQYIEAAEQAFEENGRKKKKK